MSTDTPTTATPDQRRILADLVDEHNRGWHTDTPHPGCAGCLLSGALETEVVGE